jgi:hypothetical protein
MSILCMIYILLQKLSIIDSKIVIIIINISVTVSLRQSNDNQRHSYLSLYDFSL